MSVPPRGITLPNLDDRTYDDLTAEARALLPVLAPAWTDHNPSDPGIALVELLAWLTEMLMFGVNQIPPAHTVKFLQLLNGPMWTAPDGALEPAVDDTLRVLRERYRAVTPDDYEHLVRDTWPASPESAGSTGIRRVRCIAGRNLAGDPDTPAPAHVSVVVLPEPAGPDDRHPRPAEPLTGALARFLEPRRILTTRQHVVGPAYVDVAVAADLALHADAPPLAALEAARARLATFLDPLDGGADWQGWPFGRAVYTSEVYALLEAEALVDFVDDVRLTGPRPLLDADGQVVGIALDDHELVRLARVDLLGYDGYGHTHPLTWTSP